MVQGNCRSQASRVLWLVGSLLGSAAVILPIASAWQAVSGVLSAAVAGVTCLVGGLMALLPVARGRGPNQILAQVLWAMMARMGVPLLVCVIVYVRRGRLAEAGFVYYLLAFYLVTLIVETVLQVGQRPAAVTDKCTG